MSDIQIKQMPVFKKAYKRIPDSHKLVVDEMIRTIIKNPDIGEKKRGDLAGFYVCKFKINQQQFLLAYEWDSVKRLLLALGVHENFYRDLKKR